MARTYTEQEARDFFLAELEARVDFYKVTPGLTVNQRLEQLAGALLQMIDGDNGEVPLWILAPNPDPETVAFHLAIPENYWGVSRLCEGVDISGTLQNEYLEDL